MYVSLRLTEYLFVWILFPVDVVRHCCECEVFCDAQCEDLVLTVTIRPGAAVIGHRQYVRGCGSDHTRPGPQAQDEELGETS